MSGSLITLVSQGVQKLANQTVAEASKVKEKLLNDGQTNDELATFSSLWEIPEPVEYCRGCENKFSTRKHHCRSCAGVFCDDCAPSVVLTSSFEHGLLPQSLNIPEGQPVRICQGCRRGECPSRGLIEVIRKRLDDQVQFTATQSKTSAQSALERLQHKMALKVSEVVGTLGEDENGVRHLGLFQIKLHRGSFYGENGLTRKASSSRAAAMSGYFELFNKSSEVVALKLMRFTDNALFELPRPSFLSVAPGDAVYAFFDPAAVTSLHLLVLCANPHPMPAEGAILYDTRAHGAQPERISPCARVSEQRKALVYRLQCPNRNVVLKYKGAGVVLPREGNSVRRVGWMGRLQNRRFASNLLDLTSNIQPADCTLDFIVALPSTS